MQERERERDWCDAAAVVAAANDLPINSVRIGHIDGDLFDPRLAWAQVRGITAKGAVLVRPDRVIGWRRADAAEDAAAMLAEAVSAILGRALPVRPGGPAPVDQEAVTA